MDKKEKNHLFSKRNYLILLAGIILILVGFILMSGNGSTLTAYNPDIFSNLRIRIAPLLCVIGYLICIVGIIISPVSKSEPGYGLDIRNVSYFQHSINRAK